MKLTTVGMLCGIAGALISSSIAMAADPSFKASLVDPEKKAAQATATVKVEVMGAKLTDPASRHEKPMPGEVHIHYRLDDGPVVATTAPKLSWHELSPGKHTFTVNLADNAHQKVGDAQTLSVEIPAQSGGMSH